MSHARLAPSAAHRWMNCPGSPDLEATRPDSSSVYAAEGTLLHSFLPDALPYARQQNRVDVFNHLIGTDHEVEGHKFSIGHEHVDVLEWCANVFLGHLNIDPTSVAMFERKVYIPGRADCYGTADVIMYSRMMATLTVLDWKFGAGVQVFAKENEQAIIYALGAFLLLDGIEDIRTIHIAIGQPRLEHHDVWVIGADELRGWLRRVHDGAAATDRSAVYTAGDWCKFCRAAAVCPALRAQALATARSEFARLETATPDQLAEAMQAIPRIEEWVKAIRAETFRRLNNGERVPGWKIGEGRRAQEYVDETKATQFAIKTFGRDGFKPAELLTPAQLRALAKKREIDLPEGLIEWRAGKPSVMPESDARPAQSAAQIEFGPVKITADDL